MSDSRNPNEGLGAAEASLGRALVLLHRAASRLDDSSRHAEVQAALRHAAELVEQARHTHGGGIHVPLGAQKVSTAVTSEIAAVIAAAVSVALDRPYRLVSVQQVSVPVVPHLNVWAVEGRTQIFMSHRVR
ncbi:MAG TPA: hypothetical protein VEH04_20185 [Verrucomicrobiae bacterium]|nr:hypothetical protein [Verrucomicrobiae bacterium]